MAGRITVEDNIAFAHAYVNARRKKLGLPPFDWSTVGLHNESDGRKNRGPNSGRSKLKRKRAVGMSYAAEKIGDEIVGLSKVAITDIEKGNLVSFVGPHGAAATGTFDNPEVNTMLADSSQIGLLGNLKKSKPIVQFFPNQLDDDREWAKQRGYHVGQDAIEGWYVWNGKENLANCKSTEAEALDAARNLAKGEDRNTYLPGTVYNKNCKCCNEPFQTIRLGQEYKWGHKPATQAKPKAVKASSIPPTDPIKLLEFKRAEAVKEAEACVAVFSECDKELAELREKIILVEAKQQATVEQQKRALEKVAKIDTAVAALKDI